MDKPVSLSMKDFLVRKLAVKLMIPEKTIDAVISDEFSSANKALLGAKSVEISGLGKFYFNEKKAKKKYNNLLEKHKFFENVLKTQELTEQKRLYIEKILANNLIEIEMLKPKIDVQPGTDIRGMEEQPHSS